jgi:Cu(I)/Ag(I) efflux system protein CusF
MLPNFKVIAAAAVLAAASSFAALAQTPMVAGTIEKLDIEQGKLTIKHGKIPNLNMDEMTMIFRAQDPAMLKAVKPGDRIRFSADRVNGQITVTKIEKTR